MKRCSFITFGCKINQYDTQALRESILDLGYTEVPATADSDVVVVNSCTVTNRAGEKGVAAVRRIAKRQPDARILVTGCMSGEDRRELERIPQVETVVGNEEKDQIPALLQGQPRVPVNGRRSRNIFNLEASRFSGHTRAFLKIHDGCDDFCTYCIIPFVRGKSMSRTPHQVIAEARRFAEAGYREVVLTGIHLRQYGRDLEPKATLVELLRELRRIDGIARVRLSSIGMRAFTRDLLELFANDDGLCPFFHVPLQSGSDRVLARMRRDYTADEYLGAIACLRDALPRALVTTDLMVGFPGESEADFEASLELCRAARLGFLHVFPYSRRVGTKADKMPDHVEPAAKRDRIQRARELDVELRRFEGQRWLGREVRVLIERHGDRGCSGLSREGHRVVEESSEPNESAERGREVTMRIVGHGQRGHRGQRLDVAARTSSR